MSRWTTPHAWMDADRLGDAAGEAQQVGRGHRAAVLDDLVERRAGDVAGHDVGPGRHDVGVDDARDPGVADARERVDLAREPLAGVGVVRDVGAQHLDRDGATTRVEGEVHDPHAPLADLLDEAVGADPLLETRTSGPRPRGAAGAGTGARAGPRGGHPLGPVVRSHAPTVCDVRAERRNVAVACRGVSRSVRFSRFDRFGRYGRSSRPFSG